MPLLRSTSALSNDSLYFDSLEELDRWTDTHAPRLRGVLRYHSRPVIADSGKRGKLLVNKLSFIVVCASETYRARSRCAMTIKSVAFYDARGSTHLSIYRVDTRRLPFRCRIHSIFGQTAILSSSTLPNSCVVVHV